MRLLGIITGIILLSVIFAFAQSETLTVTTYYPSPSGIYEDLDIYSNLTYRDPGGSGTSLVAKTDATGNLHLNATVADFHIWFDDVDRPYAYLQSYGVTGTTYCADGYFCASFLDSNKLPADPDPAPQTGFYVCIRGQ
jgi:hypothetical protein